MEKPKFTEPELLEYFKQAVKQTKDGPSEAERLEGARIAALAKNYADAHGWLGFTYND